MMEKVDFVFIEGIEPRSNSFSVFVGYLFPVTAAILEKGFTFKILSLRLLKDYSIRGLINELENIEFKAVCMTTTADSIRYVYKVCNNIKNKYPKIPIILGGPQASYDSINIMDKCSCDFIIHNEGDYKNIEILQEFYGTKDFAKISGITWRNNGKIVVNKPSKPLDINTLPTPNYGLLNNESCWLRPIGVDKNEFMYKVKAIRDAYTFFMTGRGCPNKCSFCVEGNSLNTFRFRNVERLREDLICFLKSTGHQYIAIADDTFTSSLKRVREICEMFKDVQKKYPFTWYCEGRVDILSRHPEILDTMVDAGLVSLQIGIESGRQEIIDIYNKRIKVEQIKDVIIQARQYPKLRIFGNIILGNPHETMKQLQESLSVIDELVKLSRFKLEISTSILTPFVGTPIRTNSKDYGIELLFPNFEERRFSFSDIVCKPDTMTISEMYSLKSVVEKHFQEFACKELLTYENLKQYLINLTTHERVDHINIWISRNRVTASYPFKSYLSMLTMKNIVIEIDKYNIRCIDEMFPLALWELDYNFEEKAYIFISLNNKEYKLCGVDALLWDKAVGNKTTRTIYKECKKLYADLDYQHVISFYKEMDKQLALLFKTI